MGTHNSHNLFKKRNIPVLQEEIPFYSNSIAGSLTQETVHVFRDNVTKDAETCFMSLLLVLSIRKSERTIGITNPVKVFSAEEVGANQGGATFSCST